MNNNIDPWDINAPSRQDELKSREDITYWKLLVPSFCDEIKNITPNEKVIDVGCGLGYLTNEIASRVKEITGIDTSKESIKYAKENFNSENIKFFNLSILDFQKKYQDTRYDICIANMVFHNIPNLDENLSAIKKLLNKNGHLIFTIPHPAFWYATREFEKLPSYKYETEKMYKVPFKIKNHEKHPCDINYYHRPLEWYEKLLEKNDFGIDSFREPSLGLYSQKKDAESESDIFYCIYRLK